MTTTRTFYDLIKTAPKGRFAGIKRNYTVEEVAKLRSSVRIDYTLATRGANRLWDLLKTEPYINALGALSGNQAMQMVRGGLKAIYLSGWQVAADSNAAGAMYPDQSLYPANSGPDLCRKINRTLQRADEIEHCDGGAARRDWFVPIVADAEAGFGGPLNCFEIMKAYIEAGAAGVHFEDQLAAEKKCGHLGGKVLIATRAHERNLNAARLAADVYGVPSVLISRTDAESAKLITSDVDERDHDFIDLESGRTAEGFHRLKPGTGLAHCIRRGLSAAPYADLLWWETSTPDLKMAKEFSEAILKEYPDKMMAYNCSPSFNWEANLTKEQIAAFQKEIGAMGYKFQFVTLAGFHAINYSMFQLALDYKDRGMAAYSRMQQAEFALARYGYTAINHQHEVGTGYFDQVALAAGGGTASTTALDESTEAAQFRQKVKENQMKGKKGAAVEEEEEQPRLSYANRPVGTSYDPFHVRPSRSFHTSARQHAHKSSGHHREGGDGGSSTTIGIPGLQVTMPKKDGDEKVLSKEALEFLLELHRKFEPRRQSLLNARIERQHKIDGGHDLPHFLNETSKIRESEWSIGGTPQDLQDRRVEITGPVDRKMVINALNSGARTFMADFEDSNTPTWRNQIEGQQNLMDAARRRIIYTDQQTHREYKLADKTAVLIVRPRGWHLPERHVMITGQGENDRRVPMSGSLFDFGLYFFHNARELLERKSGPYFYLPKMQSHKEAELWNDVFVHAQDKLGIPKGSIKCTVLIEHILATFEADEILHALKDHIVGLNCGRWDYIFSYIKTFQAHSKYLLPDRQLITMATPFMRSYSKFVIRVCHRRGAHAMGGMAAFIPVKNDPKVNTTAMDAVRKDKEREATDGHDGTWVAHPGLVQLATDVFDKFMPTPNQVDKLDKSSPMPSANDLLAVPDGSRTEDGLRRNVSVCLGYLESWLRGQGCVPLYNLMEDAATAEISRAQLWQWLHHHGKLDDGRLVDEAMLKRVINDETARWTKSMTSRKTAHDPSATLGEAANLLRQMLDTKEMPEFLTTPAYDLLIEKGL